MIKTFGVLLVIGFLQISLIMVATFSSGCSKPITAQQSEMNLPTTQADQAFQKGADQPPTLRTLYTMATILAAQGRDAQTEAVLLRILREHPDFVPAYNDLAELKMRQRQIDEAIKILSKGLQIDSSDPVLLNNLGMCWMIKRNYEKALQMFTKAAGFSPQNTRYRANMAVALGFQRRDQEALALYRQILPEDQANHNLEIIRAARDKDYSSISPPLKDLNIR